MCYPVSLVLKTKSNPDLIKLQGEMANLAQELKRPQSVVHRPYCMMGNYGKTKPPPHW